MIIKIYVFFVYRNVDDNNNRFNFMINNNIFIMIIKTITMRRFQRDHINNII